MDKSDDLSCFIEWNDVKESQKKIIEIINESVFEVENSGKSYLVICGFRKLLIVRYYPR